MVTHYFTLKAITTEFGPVIGGGVISEIYSQQEDELVIVVEMNAGVRGLAISVRPKLNYVFLRETPSRAKRNSVDLFPMLIGQRIESVTTATWDRTIILTTSAFSVHLKLYDGSASNIIVCDAERVCVGAFHGAKDLTGKALAPPESRPPIQPNELIAQLNAGAHGNDESAAFAWVKRAAPVFGAMYAREALFRAKIEEQTRLSALTEEQREELPDVFSEIFSQAAAPSAVMYMHDGLPAAFSVIPLSHLGTAQSEAFANVNLGVRICVSNLLRASHSDNAKSDLAEKLTALFDKTERALEASRAQSTANDRAAEYERIGKLLMGNLGELQRGLKEITLTDLETGIETKIALEPALNGVKNAERYFGKARKSRAAQEEAAERAQDLLRQRNELRELMLACKACESADELKEFTAKNEERLRPYHLAPRAGTAPGGNREAEPPFRIFRVAGDFEVWVGKSSANNDLLTMKYSKPNDLWFHARGSSGSHTVLKVRDTNSPPPKEAITQAAAIAAYYSKMRNASNVPVAYCERKYVRKPKGLKEGAVFLEREKVVFVQPKLPA
jgi:predicted ribosome quality control (RQC) complex YloA/Tae2 family protein